MAIKILSIDDELDMKELILQKFRRKIRDNEFEFLFAYNGLEALDILRDNDDINIILADINMPKMNGLEFLKSLKELHKPLIHVIMVSAYGDMNNLRLAMNLGAFDFINKPIDFVDMEKTIHKAIGKIDLIIKQQNVISRLSQIENEVKAAGVLQSEILPTINGQYMDYEDIIISTFIKPAFMVGGDLYNVYALDIEHIGFLIADVSGKGILAASFMLISQTALKIYAHQDLKPNEVLKQVNMYLEDGNESSMFTTTFYGILNIKTGEFEYSNGGHNPPLWINNGEAKYLPSTNNMALGVVSNSNYENNKIVLSPKDVILLYTDGVSEAQNVDFEQFGDERMVNVVCENCNLNPNQINSKLYNSIMLFCENAEQFDDITMLTIKWK